MSDAYHQDRNALILDPGHNAIIADPPSPQAIEFTR
jgi:hypothetical protein